MSILDEVPPVVVDVTLIFVATLVRLMRAGADSAARREALMSSVEALKAQLDAEKFGGG